MLKPLPIGISTFSKIIEKNCLYVDKTQYLYQLVTSETYYFLSRPRRFGKSLMVSTLKEIFEGRSELFKNLWIGQSDYQFEKHPVINLDFGKIDHGTPTEFQDSLRNILFAIARSYEIDLKEDRHLGLILTELVQNLAIQKPVVLLIDEYDKPILDHPHNPETAEAMRAVLHGFFSTVKGLDAYWQFVFLTGVTKFSKTSVFSGLNNLNDISEDSHASSLVGYTQLEIEQNFGPYIENLAKLQNLTPHQTAEKLKSWYNGYRFSRNLSETVYNPYSVLYCLHKNEFSNYWFESGTPSFLIKLVKEQDFGKVNYEDCMVGPSAFLTFDFNHIQLIPVFYQTGYLTIKDYDAQDNIYHLGFPNQEVRESMSGYLVANLAHTEKGEVEASIGQIRKALRANNVEKFVELLQSLFANIPAKLHIPEERYYHSLLQLTCNLLGLDTHSEINTSKGVIDIAIEFPLRIFVIELKLKHGAEIALQQIIDRNYADKYQIKQKPITLIGLSFDRQEDGLKIESVSKNL